MVFWKNYEGHKTDIVNEYDNTIYTFDIETSTYLIFGRKQLKPLDYLKFTDEEKENVISQSLCYIWQFSINDVVYYGRTLEDFVLFLQRLDYFTGYCNKIVYVHNLRL